MWRRYFVWAKTFVLLAALISLAFEAECLLPIPLVGKKLLLYHDIIGMELPSKYQCIELCLAFKLCRSVYFNGGQCVINSDQKKDRQFQFKNLLITFLLRSQIPQEIEAGSCTTPSCRIDEMCVADATNPTCVKHVMILAAAISRGHVDVTPNGMLSDPLIKGKSIVKCPSHSFRKGNTCYKLFPTKKTWNESKNFCVDEGSKLVEMHSSAGFIEAIAYLFMNIYGVGGKGAFWTGLVYSSPQTAWIWDGSRDSLTYNMFSPTIPTNQDGMCMGVSYVNETVLRTWKSVECDTKDVFICQYESPDFWQ